MSVGAEFDALQPEDTDHDRQTTALTRAAYGVANNHGIEFSAPVIYLQNTVEPNAGGYGDTQIGIKYQIRDDTRGPAVALAFSVQAPTGDAVRDIGSGGTMTWINAIRRWCGGWPLHAHAAARGDRRRDVDGAVGRRRGITRRRLACRCRS